MAEGLARLEELAAHPVVATVARAFAEAGRDLAIVGGPVRDALLGRTTHDFDFTTDARPDEILALVKPISSVQWDVGRAFGTIGARVKGEQVEITTFRADSYDGVTRKPRATASGREYPASADARNGSSLPLAERLAARHHMQNALTGGQAGTTVAWRMHAPGSGALAGFWAVILIGAVGGAAVLQYLGPPEPGVRATSAPAPSPEAASSSSPR